MTFFSPVEDGYYPHAWHINTRVRKSVLLARYRVFRTISSEDADMVHIYQETAAYTLHTTSAGRRGALSAPPQVIVKAWVTASDFECQREVAAYRALGPRKFNGSENSNAGSTPCPGVPAPRVAAAVHDPICDVHALVLPKLGPTLEDLRALLPENRFDVRMVLVVAIEMIERYRSIHARGLIHNGIKPANICLAPRDSSDAPSMLYAIDFGFSFELDLNNAGSGSPTLPSAHRIDAVGNRRFMSVFAHHGISELSAPLYLKSNPTTANPSATISSPSRTSSPTSFTRTSLGPARHSRNSNASSRSPPRAMQQPAHVWRVKLATPASLLFRDMPVCFAEFWRDVKALAYAEVPDYDAMKGQFVACLEGEYEGGRRSVRRGGGGIFGMGAVRRDDSLGEEWRDRRNT
ncbi:kinase-like domain-containing protein [Mycena galopus ATCC 62051]|nr:kinase-like domain-containing protein [Mycena galopus ATCC 62051]